MVGLPIRSSHSSMAKAGIEKATYLKRLALEEDARKSRRRKSRYIAFTERLRKCVRFSVAAFRIACCLAAFCKYLFSNLKP